MSCVLTDYASYSLEDLPEDFTKPSKLGGQEGADKLKAAFSWLGAMMVKRPSKTGEHKLDLKQCKKLRYTDE